LNVPYVAAFFPSEKAPAFACEDAVLGANG